MLDRLAADIASALRSLYAAPALPIAAILTTALAVGMNLATRSRFASPSARRASGCC